VGTLFFRESFIKYVIGFNEVFTALPRLYLDVCYSAMFKTNLDS